MGKRIPEKVRYVWGADRPRLSWRYFERHSGYPLIRSRYVV